MLEIRLIYTITVQYSYPQYKSFNGIYLLHTFNQSTVVDWISCTLCGVSLGQNELVIGHRQVTNDHIGICAQTKIITNSGTVIQELGFGVLY